MLFEAEARGISAADLVAERIELSGTDAEIADVPDYSRVAIAGVCDEGERIDDTLTSYLQDWTLARLPAVDRAIMRLAVWELLYADDDVPPVVAVDEAVELAKELSTDDSPGFVNGVLGQIVLIAPQVRAAAKVAAFELPETSE